MNAGLVLTQAAAAAVGGVAGLSQVHEGRPVQAAFPYALIGTGVERDWSHKSGIGRELTLSLTIRDKGESSARARALAGAAEAAIEGLGGELGGWRLIGLHFLRAALRAETNGEWAALSEYRARMLRI